MFKKLKTQRAFTLIELLVVILIIGILIAVAAPSFLGQQKKAYDSQSMQELTVTYKNGKSTRYDDINGDASSYAPITAVPDGPVSIALSNAMISKLQDSEPQYTFAYGDANVEGADYTDPDNPIKTTGTIYVKVTANFLKLTSWSRSGRYCSLNDYGTGLFSGQSVGTKPSCDDNVLS